MKRQLNMEDFYFKKKEKTILSFYEIKENFRVIVENLKQ